MFSKLGTGSDAEQHKNTEDQSTNNDMTYVRPYIQLVVCLSTNGSEPDS